MIQEISLILCLCAEGAAGFAQQQSSLTSPRFCLHAPDHSIRSNPMDVNIISSVSSTHILLYLLAFNGLTTADVGTE